MIACGQAVLSHDAWRGMRNPKTQEVMRTGDPRAGRLIGIMTRRHFMHVMPMAMMVEFPPGSDVPASAMLYGFSQSMSGAHDFSFRMEDACGGSIEAMLDAAVSRLSERTESASVLAVVLSGTAPASRPGWRMMRGCGLAMESDRRALYPEVFYEAVLDPVGGRLCFVPVVDERRAAAFVSEADTARDQVVDLRRMISAPAWGYGKNLHPLSGRAAR